MAGGLAIIVFGVRTMVNDLLTAIVSGQSGAVKEEISTTAPTSRLQLLKGMLDG